MTRRGWRHQAARRLIERSRTVLYGRLSSYQAERGMQMTMSSRSAGLVAFALMLAPMLSWPAAVQAQDYPTRPVKIIVPFGAGGAPAVVYPLCVHASISL